MDKQEIERLVSQCRHGDEDAFVQLIDQFHPSLYRVSIEILQNPQEAEDAVQEIFIKVWMNLSNYRRGSFQAWIHTLGVRHCLDRLRKLRLEARRQYSTSSYSGKGDTVLDRLSDAPNNPGETWQRRLILQEAMESLPPDDRVILTLHYFSDISITEIALQLKMPIRTVYYRLQRALGKMKEKLGEGFL